MAIIAICLFIKDMLYFLSENRGTDNYKARHAIPTGKHGFDSWQTTIEAHRECLVISLTSKQNVNADANTDSFALAA